MAIRTTMREYGQKYDVLLPQLGSPGDLGFILSRNGEKALNRNESQKKADSKIEPARENGIATIESPSKQPLQERVKAFLNRAYRRDVPESELASEMQLVEKSQVDDGTEVKALQRLVQSILASSDFLFISEPIRDDLGKVRKLDDFELATRLSYFLWASMPDDELLALARKNRLSESGTLHAQVKRMLADRRRSRELSESFAVQWLRLDQLYTAKPDPKLYGLYGGLPVTPSSQPTPPHSTLPLAGKATSQFANSSKF